MNQHFVFIISESGSTRAEALRALLRDEEIRVCAPARERHEAADVSALAVIVEVDLNESRHGVEEKIRRARRLAPDAPLIALRGSRNSHANSPDEQPEAPPEAAEFVLHDAALKSFGFRHVADEPGRIVRLLRNFVRHPVTGETDSAQEVVGGAPTALGDMSLPQNIDGERLLAAFEFVASLHFSPDQQTTASSALAKLAPITPADRWAIYLTTGADAEGSEELILQPLAVRGLSPGERVGAREEVWWNALIGGAPALSRADQRAASQAATTNKTTLLREANGFALAVPLACNGKQIGVLEAARERETNFSEADVRLIESLAVPLAAALANSVRIAEAERLSLTDDLTKLHNGRYLRQFLTNELKRARRYGGQVAAIFLDIDNFKTVNDTHGHLVGSHVLVKMAGILLDSVRDTDVVARYGGDEFVVVLPEAGVGQALRVAERMRAKLAQTIFTGGRRLHLQLTASFGVAAFPEHAASPQQLIAGADAAMYEAKADGKNCVCVEAGVSAEMKNEKFISKL